MNSRTWISALHTVKVLCAIDKPAHADYVQGMYDELEKRFSDEEIKTAVRQIAEKEELYGNYPSLRVWLKYCPQTKAIRHENDKLKTEFLDEISAVVDKISDGNDASEIIEKDSTGVLPENEILWRQLQALRKTNVNWSAIS